MDITIDVDNYKLNVRAAGVMIHNGKILVHRNINSDHYALIGGRRIRKKHRNNRIYINNRKLFWDERFKIPWNNVCT